MSAETLRRAAALIRERAEASKTAFGYGPWVVGGLDEFGQYTVLPANQVGLGSRVAADLTEDDAEHIASWHPAVALAVADWLDREDDEWERHYDEWWSMHLRAWDRANNGAMPDKTREHFQRTATEYADGQHRPALAVARAYLGESA